MSSRGNQIVTFSFWPRGWEVYSCTGQSTNTFYPLYIRKPGISNLTNPVSYECQLFRYSDGSVHSPLEVVDEFFNPPLFDSYCILKSLLYCIWFRFAPWNSRLSQLIRGSLAFPCSPWFFLLSNLPSNETRIFDLFAYGNLQAWFWGKI